MVSLVFNCFIVYFAFQHKVVYYLAVLLRHHEDGKLKNSLVPIFLVRIVLIQASTKIYGKGV